MSRFFSEPEPVSENTKVKFFSKHTFLQRVTQAVQDVNDGRLTYKCASEKHGVAVSTITRRVKGVGNLATRRGGKMKVSEDVAKEAVRAVQNKELSVRKASKIFKLSEKAIRNRLKASEELEMVSSRMQSTLPVVSNNCSGAETFDNGAEMSSVNLSSEILQTASTHGTEKYQEQEPEASFQIVGDIDSLPISRKDLILALQTMSQQNRMGSDVPETIIISTDSLGSAVASQAPSEESATTVCDENLSSVNAHGIIAWNEDTAKDNTVDEFSDSEESRLAKAVDSVKSKKMSALTASRKFGLPQRMILKRVAKSVLEDIQVDGGISAEQKDSNLMRAITAVLEKKMTTKEAGKIFGVKRKAITCRISGEVSLRGGQSTRKMGVAEATNAVLENGLTLAQACKTFKVPKSSVFSRLKRMKSRRNQENTGLQRSMSINMQDEGGEYDAAPNQERHKSFPLVPEYSTEVESAAPASVLLTKNKSLIADNVVGKQSHLALSQRMGSVKAVNTEQLTSDLEKAVEAVHDEKLSLKVASQTYDIPVGIVCSKVLSKILTEVLPMPSDVGENMMMAIQAVQEKQMVISQASKHFAVSSRALSRRLRGNMSGRRASSRNKIHDAVKAVFEKNLTSCQAAKIYGVNLASLYRVLSLVQKHKCFGGFSIIRGKKRTKKFPSNSVHEHMETSRVSHGNELVQENEQILLHFDELYPDPNILKPEMICALEAVSTGKMSRRLAAKSFKISPATLATKLDKNSHFHMTGRLRKAIYDIIKESSGKSLEPIKLKPDELRMPRATKSLKTCKHNHSSKKKQKRFIHQYASNQLQEENNIVKAIQAMKEPEVPVIKAADLFNVPSDLVEKKLKQAQVTSKADVGTQERHVHNPSLQEIFETKRATVTSIADSDNTRQHNMDCDPSTVEKDTMAAPPSLATDAVMVQSESMPVGSETVQGYDFNKGVDYHALLQSYTRSGFQATNFGKAIEEINKMIDKKMEPISEEDQKRLNMNPCGREKTNCTIFLGYTSNLISSGVREILRYLAQHNMVDCIVTTAGGIEEDFIKCLAPTFIGEFSLDGRTLRNKGINRIGNLLVPNNNYCEFEKWLMPILDQMLKEQKEEGTCWTPSKMIARLGKEIENEESVYYWAYKNNIPVFCPALTDGSIGDMIYFHSYKNPGLVLDLVEDIRRLNGQATFAINTGMIILGGGVIKHHICNANLMRNGADFSLFVNVASEFDGSDSGARPDEAISWGKIKQSATPVKVYAETTLVFPLMVAETFAQREKEFRDHNQ
ncbi:hypothetical protein ScPMuIL_011083 [Solemya velum]